MRPSTPILTASACRGIGSRPRTWKSDCRREVEQPLAARLAGYLPEHRHEDSHREPSSQGAVSATHSSRMLPISEETDCVCLPIRQPWFLRSRLPRPAEDRRHARERTCFSSSSRSFRQTHLPRTTPLGPRSRQLILASAARTRTDLHRLGPRAPSPATAATMARRSAGTRPPLPAPLRAGRRLLPPLRRQPRRHRLHPRDLPGRQEEGHPAARQLSHQAHDPGDLRRHAAGDRDRRTVSDTSRPAPWATSHRPARLATRPTSP